MLHQDCNMVKEKDDLYDEMDDGLYTQ